MNEIREAFAKICPRHTWPRSNLSQREIGFLLLDNSKATRKQFYEKLGVVPIPQEVSPVYHSTLQQPVFAFCIHTENLVDYFDSKIDACRNLFLTKSIDGRCSITYSIRNNLVFNYRGTQIVLTQDYQINTRNYNFRNTFNLSVLRLSLHEWGYTFVQYDTSKETIRNYFDFDYNTTLKQMMDFFYLPWVKKDCGGYNQPVYTRVVLPMCVLSPRMSMRGVSKRLSINIRNVREYIDRQVFFEYNTPNVRDSYLVYA